MKQKMAWAVAVTAIFTVGAGTALAADLAVGVELPLTGSLARAGNAQLEGITVAAQLFNQRDSKYTIKLITVDDEAQPAKAVAAVEKLASQGVLAITGGYGSNAVTPASEAADKAGLVYITSGGVDSGMTSRGLKSFFRIGPASGYEKAMVGLLSDMSVKSVSIVYSTKEAPSDLAASVSKTLAANGVKVTQHAFDPAITDFKPIINKVKLQDRPDVLVMMGYENDYIGILRAAKVLKPQVKSIVASWSLATVKMATEFPDLVQNTIGTAMMSHPVQFTAPEGKVFVAAYQKAFHKDPDYLSEFSYVQSMMLFDAMVRAADKGTLKTGGIASELRAKPYDTLIGKVQFDSKGDNPAFLNHMAQLRDGKITVVWPKDAATGQLVYPAVPW